MKYFAIGDVHGRFDLLTTALEAIGDLEAQDARLVFLGDYVDRGPQSREVVERLIELSKNDRVICLRGNHEEMMVLGTRGDDIFRAEHWYRNGGEATAQSYRDEYPQEHLDWMAALPVSHETPWHFFVHAGIRPGVPLDRQIAAEMLWIRGVFLDDPRDHGLHIVHGHTPRQAPELLHNRTNLDTGAYASGNLTIGVFEGAGGPSEVWVVRQDGVTRLSR